jgi:hypothetical protein
MSNGLPRYDIYVHPCYMGWSIRVTKFATYISLGRLIINRRHRR